MHKIELNVTTSVYKFLVRYYTSGFIGDNLLLAINEGFIYANGKNFSLSDLAAAQLKAFIEAEVDDTDYSSDI